MTAKLQYTNGENFLTSSTIAFYLTKEKYPGILTLILTLLWALNALASDSIQETRLSAILVSNDSLAQELLHRIYLGEDFAALANKYSKYPNAPPDGDLGVIAISDLAMPLRSWAMSLEVGGISKVISTDNGFFILKKTDTRVSVTKKQQVSPSNSQLAASIIPMVVVLGIFIVLVFAVVNAARKKGYGGLRVFLGISVIVCAAVGTVGSLSEAIKIGFAPGHLSALIFALILIIGGVRLLIKPQSAPISEGVEYSDFWPRLLSLLIDSAIFFTFVYTTQSLLSKYSLPMFIVANIGTSIMILIAGILFLWKYGATPGKMIVGIQVVKLDFRKVTLREVFLRFSVDIVFVILYIIAFLQLLKVMDFSTYSKLASGARGKYFLESFPEWYEYIQLASHTWFFSEVIVLLFNKKRRAIHDFIAGTVVVKKNTLGQIGVSKVVE